MFWWMISGTAAAALSSHFVLDNCRPSAHRTFHDSDFAKLVSREDKSRTGSSPYGFSGRSQPIMLRILGRPSHRTFHRFLSEIGIGLDRPRSYKTKADILRYPLRWWMIRGSNPGHPARLTPYYKVLQDAVRCYLVMLHCSDCNGYKALATGYNTK